MSRLHQPPGRRVAAADPSPWRSAVASTPAVRHGLGSAAATLRPGGWCSQLVEDGSHDAREAGGLAPITQQRRHAAVDRLGELRIGQVPALRSQP